MKVMVQFCCSDWEQCKRWYEENRSVELKMGKTLWVTCSRLLVLHSCKVKYVWQTNEIMPNVATFVFMLQAAVRQHMFSAVPSTHLLIKIPTIILFSLISQLTFSIPHAASTVFVLNIHILMTRYFVTYLLVTLLLLQCYYYHLPLLLLI